MRRRTLALIAAAGSAFAAPLGALAPLVPSDADVAAMRDYIEKDRAYPPAGRAEALRRLDRLPRLKGDPAAFELEVARIAALANNGHSFLPPAQWTTRYRRSPVHLGLFADGLFVIAAPDAQREALRRRVIAINGRPWRTVHGAYSRYQGGAQPFRDQFVTLFMETPALLAAAGLGTDPNGVELTLERSGGGRETIRVPATLAPLQGEAAFLGTAQLVEAAALIAPERRPLYLQAPDQPFRLQRLRDLDAAYIRLNAVRGDGLTAFLVTTLADLRAQRPRHIVVDLRFNMGGDLNIARDFMQALPALADGGQLYAITSGRTFSAAISSLGYLKQAAGERLTIVGEPIGDRLEFWAEGNMVELPGLGPMLLFATERHNYVTGCPEPDCHGPIQRHPIRIRSLQPDIATPLRFADFIAGRDPAMEAIARHAAGR